MAAYVYSWLVLRSYDSFNPPYIGESWEGKVPYISRWEIALPWFCLTGALAAYLAGMMAVRRWGKALVATSVVVAATLVVGLLLVQAVRTRDRDYAEQYGCREIIENTYRCEGGHPHRPGEPGPVSEAELQPPYPHPHGFFAAVSLGLAIFSAAPRLARGIKTT